ncbi:hypothetical protein AKJ16_DCAP20152, partial [Drosera capensis]
RQQTIKTEIPNNPITNPILPQHTFPLKPHLLQNPYRPQILRLHQRLQSHQPLHLLERLLRCDPQSRRHDPFSPVIPSQSVPYSGPTGVVVGRFASADGDVADGDIIEGDGAAPGVGDEGGLEVGDGGGEGRDGSPAEVPGHGRVACVAEEVGGVGEGEWTEGDIIVVAVTGSEFSLVNLMIIRLSIPSRFLATTAKHDSNVPRSPSNRGSFPSITV